MDFFDTKFKHPYNYNNEYQKRIAYFSMEFAVDQSLKTYSGGLGFLAGSHMKSAYELKQNIVGVGILWKYGYYDQIRKQDQSMDVLFLEKNYSFLEETGIKFSIEINGQPVTVSAKYLAPRFFQTVPLFFLTTDLPENDYLAQSICHRLYDSDTAAKIAQFILLGIGGAKLLDHLGYHAEVIHLNEAHGFSSAFYLYQKFESLAEVRKRLVFTTHTPEEAGNEKHDIYLLHKLGYFCGLPLEEIRELTKTSGDVFNHTLSALRVARIANGVSQLHGKVACEMWNSYDEICPIIAITNSQNGRYWTDHELYDFLAHRRFKNLVHRKKYLKMKLFETVADQTGKIFDPDILTIVWARRFAGYKRPDLITEHAAAFDHLMTRADFPVQIIWAGKPYPSDYGAISTFNNLVHLSKKYKNMAVLVGHELKLSRKLKAGADIWLNNPRVPREASGTSGMTAAMNGAINLSTNDGWIPEFATPHNSFVIPMADLNAPVSMQDVHDLQHLYDILENRILPMYYKKPGAWIRMMKQSMKDIFPVFESNRMADEYYKLLYN
ncbi:MAG: alpha-glucan family phosphorylase [Chitinophagales bacterium]|nr:alpha-glucan family phosphorylase [Chitinophagales bacterium]